MKKADIQKQKEAYFVALETSDWAPEPVKVTTRMCMSGKERWGGCGALEESQLGQPPWPGALPLPRHTGNEGLDQVT